MVWSAKVSWLVLCFWGSARVFAGKTSISSKAESILSDNGILSYLTNSLLTSVLISLAIALVVRFILRRG
jgi:hypothetical protein